MNGQLYGILSDRSIRGLLKGISYSDLDNEYHQSISLLYQH